MNISFFWLHVWKGVTPKGRQDLDGAWQDEYIFKIKSFSWKKTKVQHIKLLVFVGWHLFYCMNLFHKLSSCWPEKLATQVHTLLIFLLSSFSIRVMWIIMSTIRALVTGDIFSNPPVLFVFYINFEMSQFRSINVLVNKVK